MLGKGCVAAGRPPNALERQSQSVDVATTASMQLHGGNQFVLEKKRPHRITKSTAVPRFLLAKGAMVKGELCVPAGLTEAAVHAIPSKTSYSGPARVRSYFQPAADSAQPPLPQAATGAAVLGKPQVAAFRGRTLRGAEVTLPAGFSGYFVRNSGSGKGVDDSEHVEAVRAFQSFTYWNHDLPPSMLDEVPQMMEWMHMADILHSTRPKADPVA